MSKSPRRDLQVFDFNEEDEVASDKHHDFLARGKTDFPNFLIPETNVKRDLQLEFFIYNACSAF